YVQVKAVPPHKMVVVSNGIDAEEYAPDPSSRSEVRKALNLENHFVWLTVGRLVKAKNYPLLLEAFSRVASDSTRCTLLFVGDGALREDLEALSYSLGLDNQV